MSPYFFAFAGAYLVGLLVRDGYELLKKAGKLDTRDARVFTGVFTAMIALWVGWFGMALTDPVRVPVASVTWWTGFGMVVLGLVVAVAGVAQLRGLENIDHLVTTGLYARIRHPMYVGFILWILGWSMALGAVVSLGLGALGLASILWWRYLEDMDLEARYGAGYAEYRATTWF